MRPNGTEASAETTRYHVQAATSDDLAALVQMQMALQESMGGVGANMLHLGRRSTVRLVDHYQRQIADDQTRVLVACDVPSAEVVAMGSGRIWVHAEYVPARSGELVDIWVDPDHRRRGLAGRIARRLVRFFRARRVEFLSVNYVSSNAAAEALWKGIGFHPTLITATAERRTVEAFAGMETQRIVPVGYRAAMGDEQVRASLNLLG